MAIRILSVMLCLLFVHTVKAQEAKPDTWLYKQSPSIALKTNLLYDATSTINLGAEFKTSDRWTLEIPVNYNPWTFSDKKKIKHIGVQPEMRYWLCEPFNGHFFGMHAHYAYYNVGALSDPPFSENMNTHRYQGWLVGGGVSYGYHWILSNRWSLEATIGAGYAFLDYKKYEKCSTCGSDIEENTKNYWGPTKVGLSLIYIIK